MIKVYGADWCGDTQSALRHLENAGVDFEYIDVEKDSEASEWVKNQNDGKERKPTILVGEQILSVPNKSELDAALRRENLI